MHQTHQTTQGSFKATDTKGGRGKVALLIGFSVRGVVSSNNINHVILEPLNQGLDILFSSQGWVNLGLATIGYYPFLGQGQVMRRNLGSNLNALLLGTTNKINRAFSTDMSNM